MPGASPEIMASAVATPLERQLSRIADVSEMTSSSTLGSTRITRQFALNRDINAAARDVEAAINSARSYLPTNLPSNPTYWKSNPADAPIFMLTLTSMVLTKGQMYDAASSILSQKLSQVSGVGQVIVGGSSLPAVRIELDPYALNKYGIGFEDVRGVLANANANTPKGYFSGRRRMLEIDANDQLFKAIEHRPLIVAYRNGAAVRISDVVQAVDSVEDLRNAGYANGKPSVIVLIWVRDGCPNRGAALDSGHCNGFPGAAPRRKYGGRSVHHPVLRYVCASGGDYLRAVIRAGCGGGYRGRSGTVRAGTRSEARDRAALPNQ